MYQTTIIMIPFLINYISATANHKPSKSYGIAVIVILILGFIAVLIVH